MTKATWRRSAMCLAMAAVAATSACSAKSGTPTVAVAHDSKPFSPAAAVKQPTAQQVAARQDPATQCANRVRMGLVMSFPSRPVTLQIRAFARTGASTTERRVFAAAMARYATSTRALGTTRALNQSSLSVGHLVSDCRGAA